MGKRVVFVGGGNMASAIIGRLISQEGQTSNLVVLEPLTEARKHLERTWGIETQAQAGAFLAHADMVVWAVKPQIFHEATQAIHPYTQNALHLSVAAGVRSQSISQWLHNDRIVRAMPNTPALIGKGITGLYARASVSDGDKDWASHIMSVTGQFVWLSDEDLLDAVTALSGSGPAYVFYFMEAMIETGIRMGLSPAQAQLFVVNTFIGAGELARASTEAPQVLRQRVTSKGGTTHAAIECMEASGIKEAFSQAILAAQQRARALANEFGND